MKRINRLTNHVRGLRATLLLPGLVLLHTACQRPITPTAQPDIPTPPGYRLVWHDEFDQDGPPDPRKWTYETGFVRNEERQWYQPDNARCRGGILTIEGRRETKPNPAHQAGSTNWKLARPQAEYTSTSMTTKGLNSWQYGRFEMRARIPVGPGMWPAFWTLGTEGSWPAKGEIDIMEYYRGMLLFNVIWAAGENGKNKGISTKKRLDELPDPAWAEKFHVWRLDWSADRIQIYLDDELMRDVDVNTTLNRLPDNSVGNNPYRAPHYLLLNLAIGGNQGGGANGERMAGGNPAESTYPARFEVDYVRVFQKP